MNYDYKFGNNYYKYNDKVGIKSTIYNILAPEQSQSDQPGMEFLMDPLPIFDNLDYKACDDSSYMTGQVIHNNGGQVMG